MKVKTIEEKKSADLIEHENNKSFIEVENAMKILAQGGKSIDYDLSECNLLISDTLQVSTILYLEKPLQDIEDIINGADNILNECLYINISDVQIPILKYKNKIFLKGGYSNDFFSVDYAYILELMESKKLIVKLVYQCNADLARTLPRNITKEDSALITIPEFNNDLDKFIKQNINYPKSAKKDSIRGRVVVTFWVEPDLTTTGFEIIKSINKDMDKRIREEFNNEALRVAKLIPFKNPAFQYGKPIRYKMTIPIYFNYSG